MGKDYYKHYSSGESFEALYQGWRRLLRYRSLFLEILTKILVTLGVFKYFGLTNAVFVFIAFILLYFALYLVRINIIRTDESYERIHIFFHTVRDKTAQLIKLSGEKKEGNRNVVYVKECTELSELIANHLSTYFQIQTGDKTVNCAIRIAHVDDGKECYKTLARSNGMNPNRKESSILISADKGLPLLLRNSGSAGVHIIKDIERAKIDHRWEKGSESDEYKDVKVLMIMPINGYEIPKCNVNPQADFKKSMLGILYITSQNDVFKSHHVEPLRSVADFLGLLYPILYQK